MERHTVYLCIGGNLGSREANLEETRMFITFNMGDITAHSAIYETEAWGMAGAPAFLNQVLRIETELDPPALMDEILELEDFFGRHRKEGEYASREMDVDILFYEDQVIDSEIIHIPHPRMHLRKFVLVPMNELAPEMVHPVLKKSMNQLLAACDDQMQVRPFVPIIP